MSGLTGNVAASLIGYVIGSVPVGLWIARGTHGIDVRHFGSGVTGTTNVLRTVGPRLAACVFILDVTKGAAAVLIAGIVAPGTSPRIVAGVLAIVGHSWPLFARFHGGKGVATAFGALLVVSWPIALGSAAAGLVAVAVTRVASVGSLTAAAAASILAITQAVRGGDKPIAVLCLAATTLIAVRHSANVRRLWQRTEPKFGAIAADGSRQQQQDVQ